MGQRRKTESAHGNWPEDFFRRLFQRVPTPYQSLNIKAEILEVNDAWLDLLGYKHEEVIGRSITEFLDLDGRMTLSSAFPKLTGDGKISDTRFGLISKSGKPVTVSVEGRAGYDDAGNFLQTHCLLTDVTQQESSLRALAAAEAKYRGIFEQTSDSLLVIDAHGRILDFNGAAHLSLGYSAEEFRGLSIRDFEVVETAKEVEGHIKKVLANGNDEFVTKQKRKDGSLRDVTVRTKVATIGGERVFLSAFSDITEAVDLQRDLLENQQFLRAVMDAVPQMIFLKDRDGNFLLGNKAISEAFNRADQGIDGENLANIHTNQKERDKFIADDRYVIDNQRPLFIAEESFTDAHGEKRTLQVTKVPFNTKRYGAAVLGVSEDITRQKEMERQLLQSQKMEAVGQLTGGIAHDFNNLLQVMLGNLELARRLVKDDERLGARLDKVLEAGLKGANLTKQLLAFSRRQPLNPTVIEVNGVIADLIDLLHRTLGEDIEIVTEFETKNLYVNVDVSGLENALLNLAVNARSAMPHGGRLVLKTGSISSYEGNQGGLENQPSGPFAKIVVEDNGAGIPKQILPKVFDPFFTTKESGQGSGLGLSIIYGFIKQSGGDVHLESVEGEGARVSLYLPLSSKDAVAEKVEPGPVKSLAFSGTVLVVEDNHDVAEVVDDLFTGLGMRVIRAEQGARALSLIESRKEIKLLFSDVKMPGGMNGFELADLAKKARPDIKVLLTSGYSKEELDKSRPNGAYEKLLPKPYSQADLGAAIGAVLSGT